MNGTFKIVREIFFSLFTIHANFHDHIFPVLLVLLPGKCRQIYEEMFNNIIALVPRWSPRPIMINFEKPTMNVVDVIFSRIEISGCFFHLTQNIQRFLQVRFLNQSIKIVLLVLLHSESWF